MSDISSDPVDKTPAGTSALQCGWCGNVFTHHCPDALAVQRPHERDISTVTGSDLVPAAQEALDKTFPETPMPEFPSSFAGLAAAFKNGDRARLRKALLATQREAVDPWRKVVQALVDADISTSAYAWEKALTDARDLLNGKNR